MNPEVRIGQTRIGADCKPFIVAELSGNHNGSLERALQIVDAAAQAGAHALKLQTYTADTMTLDLREREFMVEDPGSLWSGRSLYELYKEAHTPWEWHEPIFRRCRERGLIGFSAPFDMSAVAFLESLDAPCYKIASFENVDLALIQAVSATGKPVIISGGMASSDELDEAVEAARSAGCNDLILLKCTSTYPADPKHSNLRTILDMQRRFGCVVGLSDHTPGIGAAIAAVALGASVVEKHLTLRRSDGGVDAAFSLEPQELGDLVSECTQAWQALGEVRYGPTEPELASLQFRRSLYVVADVEEGATLNHENVRAIRPGLGLPPKSLSAVIGRTVRTSVKRGTPLSWNLLEDE